MSLTLDAFPVAPSDSELPPDPEALVIELPGGIVSAVVAITYLDETGAAQTLGPSAYVADLAVQPAKLAPALAPRPAWPAAAAEVGAVTIAYTVSPISGDDLAVIAQAVLLLVGFWYKNRASVAVDVRGAPIELPLTVTWLLQPLRQWPTD